MFPIAEVAEIGRELGVPLIMDNTAAPVLCRPFDHGAAIVVYSTTKYIGGHGTSIGGMIVDGGNFDWEKHAERFPMLNKPDPSYHGAVWTAGGRSRSARSPTSSRRASRCCATSARAMSPFNAFQFIQGLETLPLRMREHCAQRQRGRQLSAAGIPKVTKRHPSRPADAAKQSRRADTYLKGGFGGLVGFELKGGARGRAAGSSTR